MAESDYDGRLVEGVGNDVIFLSTGILLISISIPYIWNSYFNITTTDEVNAISTSMLTSPNQLYSTNETECPICLEHFNNQIITTNCGHNFDLNCFMNYCQHQTYRTRVSCPSCRQTVSLLFPNFNVSTADPSEDIENFRRYNRINGNLPRSYYEILMDTPELLRQLLLDTQLSRRLLSTANKIRIYFILLCGFLYILSPFDLVPEPIFGVLGYIDDIIVLFMTFIYIASIFRVIYSTVL